VTSDLHGPGAPGRAAGQAADSRAEATRAAPWGPARRGAYWTGLVVLAVGLAVTVATLATRVTSLVQTVLLAVPLALIGLGLERVGRGVGRSALRWIGTVLLVIAVVGPVVLSLSSPSAGVIVKRSAPVPAGAAQALLRVSLGGGQLRVDPEATGLYEADLRSPAEPSAQVTTSGRLAVADLRAPAQHGLLARNRGNDWAIRLSTGLPWRVEVEAGAVTADLDLQQLDTRGVKVTAGVSRLAVRLGQPAAQVPVDLQVTAGLVDVYLPRSAACELRVSGVSVDDFGQQGLVRQGGVWRTPGGTDPDRFVVHLRIGGGRVRLHRI
jgi:hypothetical protein